MIFNINSTRGHTGSLLVVIKPQARREFRANHKLSLDPGVLDTVHCMQYPVSLQQISCD